MTRPEDHCHALKIQSMMAKGSLKPWSALMEMENSRHDSRKARASHAPGSYPCAACCHSSRKCLTRVKQICAVQQPGKKLRLISWFPDPDSPLRQTLQQFSANERISHASSQPSTSHPSTWTLSSEQPRSPAGWTRGMAHCGGSRQQRRPKTLNLPPRRFQWRLCNVREREIAHLGLTSFVCSCSWKEQH